jgi:hypothetical protein
MNFPNLSIIGFWSVTTGVGGAQKGAGAWVGDVAGFLDVVRVWVSGGCGSARVGQRRFNADGPSPLRKGRAGACA